MKDILNSAVTLSILSAPSKLKLWDSLQMHPEEILSGLNREYLKTQEIITGFYSQDPRKASGQIIQRCIRKKIGITTIWDTDYPELLKQIHNPPIVLYHLGELKNNKMISIVGTRGSDEKSEEITKKISVIAAMAGYTIVSGMAIGIDRNAHLGALSVNGTTVAVLPGGVDVIYPNKNSDIYRMITESEFSAVVSEFPPGIGTGEKWTFARRNRIISGMSEAVVVVQAPLKSGAMITAKYAIEQNRDLLVCPGNAFDEKYSGCHELIKQGAAIFSDMTDLFTGIRFQNNGINLKNDVKKEKKSDKNVIIVNNSGITGNVERAIYEEICNGTIEIDHFIRNNHFSVDQVNQGITILEISGIIERKGNRLYKKRII